MARIEIELQPFNVPNFARAVQRPGTRQDGIQESPAIPLADLSADVLDEMCEDFRAAVFAKADKRDPKPRTRAIDAEYVR